MFEEVYNLSSKSSSFKSIEETYSNSLSDTIGNSRETSAGLSNLGNSCYMNAALQCLFNVSELTNYFLSGIYKTEINHSNVMGSKGRVAETYAELVWEVFFTWKPYVWPDEMKQIIGGINDQFSGYEQQDSAELLNYIIDTLHEDLNRVKDKKYIEFPKYKDEDDDTCAA